MKAVAFVLGVSLLTSGLRAETPPAPASPAQRRIALAQGRIEKAPQGARGYTELALALARRARETADPAYYARGEEAVQKALALAPGDFEARKARVWLLLGRHEFARARDEARELNRIAPDDVQVYGFLVDAFVELGDYAEAEKAAQWMLDLRPGNVPGLTRAAYLREAFGDLEGALELMVAALHQTPAAEVEDRAWVLTQIGHLQYTAGRTPEAEATLTQALALFPAYHYALAEMARVRLAQGRARDAVVLLRERHAGAPHPENLYDLAAALAAAGRSVEARTAFTEFERQARAEMEGVDNANRELVFYYADHARRPAEALAVARREIARRRDVHTLHAYAWALHVSGQHAEARRQIQAALAVGSRDPELLRHAEKIASGGARSATARAIPPR
jgi:tetratricopeptide (TPR) repeat protein